MKECRIAVWFTSTLLLLGAAVGQQSPAAPETQASQQASNSESQSAPCQPQRPTATTPFDVCKYWPFLLGPGIHAPRAESAPDPTYPEAARKAKLNGSVVVALAINAQGGVDDVKVVRSSDRRFEQSAMDAAKQWKFAPATKDGEPVAVQINAEMNFRLR
jgi:TonB family protein